MARLPRTAKIFAPGGNESTLVFACTVALTLSSVLASADVLLLKSAATRLYDDVARGVTEEIDVTTTDLMTAPEGPEGSYKAVIALGRTAAKFTATHFAALPTVFALVPDGLTTVLLSDADGTVSSQ